MLCLLLLSHTNWMAELLLSVPDVLLPGRTALHRLLLGVFRLTILLLLLLWLLLACFPVLLLLIWLLLLPIFLLLLTLTLLLPPPLLASP